MKNNYTSLVEELKEYLFQGFEWDGNVSSVKALSIDDVCYDDIHAIVRPRTVRDKLAVLKRAIISLVSGR